MTMRRALAADGQPVARFPSPARPAPAARTFYEPAALLHHDLAEHAGLIVARDQAGKFEFAALGEAPQDLGFALGVEPLAVGLLMPHVRHLRHCLAVLGILPGGGQHELMLEHAIVLEHEAN